MNLGAGQPAIPLEDVFLVALNRALENTFASFQSKMQNTFDAIDNAFEQIRLTTPVTPPPATSQQRLEHSSTPISHPEIEIVHSHLWKARCKQVALKSTAVTGGVKKRHRSGPGNIGSLATCKHPKRKVSFQSLVAEIAQDVQVDWRFQTSVVPSLPGSTVSVQSNLASNCPVSGTSTSIHNLGSVNYGCGSVECVSVDENASDGDLGNETGENPGERVKDGNGVKTVTSLSVGNGEQIGTMSGIASLSDSLVSVPLSSTGNLSTNIPNYEFILPNKDSTHICAKQDNHRLNLCGRNAIHPFDRMLLSDGMWNAKKGSVTCMGIRDKGGGLTTHCEFSNATHISVESFLQLPAKNIFADHLICKPSPVSKDLGSVDKMVQQFLRISNQWGWYKQEFNENAMSAVCVNVCKEGVDLARNKTLIQHVPTKSEDDMEEIELPPEVCDLFNGTCDFAPVTHPLYEEDVCDFLKAQVIYVKNSFQSIFKIDDYNATVGYMRKTRGYSQLLMLAHPRHVKLLENADSGAILEGLKYKCIDDDDEEKAMIVSDVPLVNVYDLIIQLIKAPDSFGWKEVWSWGILVGDRKRIFFLVYEEMENSIQRLKWVLEKKKCYKDISYAFTDENANRHGQLLVMMGFTQANGLLKWLPEPQMSRITLLTFRYESDISQDENVVIFLLLNLPGRSDGFSKFIMHNEITSTSFLCVLVIYWRRDPRYHIMLDMKLCIHSVLVVLSRSTGGLVLAILLSIIPRMKHQYAGLRILLGGLCILISDAMDNSNLGRFLVTTLLLNKFQGEGKIMVVLASSLENEVEYMTKGDHKQYCKTFSLCDEHLNAFERSGLNVCKGMGLFLTCLHGFVLSLAMIIKTFGILQLNVSGDGYVLGKTNLTLEEREQLWILNVNFQYIKISWTSKLNGGCMTGGEVYRSGAIDQLAILRTQVLMITSLRSCKWLCEFQFSRMEILTLNDQKRRQEDHVVIKIAVLKIYLCWCLLCGKMQDDNGITHQSPVEVDNSASQMKLVFKKEEGFMVIGCDIADEIALDERGVAEIASKIVMVITRVDDEFSSMGSMEVMIVGMSNIIVPELICRAKVLGTQASIVGAIADVASPNLRYERTNLELLMWIEEGLEESHFPLDDMMLLYFNGIITQFLKYLSSNRLQQSVKSLTSSCFGDLPLTMIWYSFWMIKAEHKDDSPDVLVNDVGDYSLTVCIEVTIVGKCGSGHYAVLLRWSLGFQLDCCCET